MPAFTEGYLQTNDIRLHYWRTGGGKPPIVLLHGLTSAGRSWTPVARRLADAYDVIMPDARGHGLSEGPGPAFDLKLLAADAAVLIRGLDLGQPVVIGHSMGAVTAAAVAAWHPECTRGVVLSDPPYLTSPRPTEPDEYFRAIEHNEWLQWLVPARALTREARIAAKRAERGWTDENLELWAEGIEQLRLEVVQRETCAALWLHDWRAIVPAIRCPALLLTSDPALGGIVTPAVADEVMRLLPDGRVVNIPGTGHNIHREQLEPFMAAVTDFLAELALK